MLAVQSWTDFLAYYFWVKLAELMVVYGNETKGP